MTSPQGVRKIRLGGTRRIDLTARKGSRDLVTSFKNGPLGSQSIAVRLLLREAPSRAEAAAAAGTREAGSWFMGSTAKAAGRIRGVELWRKSDELMKFSQFMVRL